MSFTTRRGWDEYAIRIDRIYVDNIRNFSVSTQKVRNPPEFEWTSHIFVFYFDFNSCSKLPGLVDISIAYQSLRSQYYTVKTRL